MNTSDPEKHTNEERTTDEQPNQEKKDWIELWKSPEAIVIEDDGEYK